jgi:hypothetical protein
VRPLRAPPIVLAALAVVLGLGAVVAYYQNAVRRQRQAIAEIEALGGDAEQRGVDPPKWLTSGVKIINTVLPARWYVSVFDWEPWSNAVTTVNLCPRYDHYLTGTGTLRHLDALWSVVNIDGCNSDLDDSTLRAVRDMVHLQTLDIGGTKVTDAGIRSLDRHNELWHLYLGNTQITDESLKIISRLPALTLIGLGRTRITDAGLPYLADMERSEADEFYLFLQDTAITDAGLMQLQHYRARDFGVSVTGTRVTQAGINALRKVRPDITVNKFEK